MDWSKFAFKDNAMYSFSHFLMTRLLKQLESGEDVSAASVVSGATPVPGTSGGAQAGMVTLSSKFFTSVSVGGSLVEFSHRSHSSLARTSKEDLFWF